MTRAPDTPGRVHQAAHHARGIDGEGVATYTAVSMARGITAPYTAAAQTVAAQGETTTQTAAPTAPPISRGGFMGVGDKTEMSQSAPQGETPAKPAAADSCLQTKCKHFS